MIFNVKDRNIELKYTMRAAILYESIQGKSFNPQTMLEVTVFFYCIVMASAKDLQLDFNEFLDMIDDNPALITEFSDWFINELNKQNTLQTQPVADEQKKTKKRTVKK